MVEGTIRAAPRPTSEVYGTTKVKHTQAFLIFTAVTAISRAVKELESPGVRR